MKARVLIPLRVSTEALVAGEKATRGWTPQKPIGGILDPRFKYVPAVKTDVAATIARVRAEIANGERKL